MLNVAYHGQPVGRLVEGSGRIFFEYDPQWLAQGHDLSPLHLPRKPGVQYYHAKSFDGLPGLFHDSLPDSWGAKLMEMRFAEKGIKPNKVTPLMRLAYVGQRGMGALTYEPAWPEPGLPPKFQQTKLVVLEREARAVVAGSAGKVLAHLVEAGGTAGGAYPKVVVAVNERVPDEVLYGGGEYPPGYTPWLVKFDLSAHNTIGPMEHAYAAMARAAGIAMPETRLFAVPDQAGTVRRHFGVKRFDRDGGERIHVHSFAGVAHKDPDKCDYRDLLLVAKALTRDMTQVLEGVRRMIFNVAASNRDDHGKNHAFVYRRGEWAFSPAFDLVFVAPSVQSMRGMGIGGEWRAPTSAQLSEVARDAGADPKAIQSITDQVAAAVQRWPHFAGEAAVPAEEIARVSNVLAPPTRIPRVAKCYRDLPFGGDPPGRVARPPPVEGDFAGLRCAALNPIRKNIMVAPAHFRRRWFIKNGTFPPGHPGADEPADGYYGSEAEAKKAKKIMVSCYGIPADKLIIAYEDASTLPRDGETGPSDSPAKSQT